MSSWNNILSANAPLLVGIIKILDEVSPLVQDKVSCQSQIAWLLSELSSPLCFWRACFCFRRESPFPCGFRPDGVHISSMLYHHCVQFCKAPSSLVCVIKTNKQQLAVQRLMAILFTAQAAHQQCRNAVIHSSITSSLLPEKVEVYSLKCFECFGMGAEQGTTASYALELSRGGSLSLNQLYKEPAPTLKTTVWCLISGRMIWVHAQGSVSYLSLYFPAGRIDQEPHHLTCKLSIYSTSYSERTGPFWQVVTNVISKEQSAQEGSSHHLQPANSQKAFLERGSLYSLCDEERKVLPLL